MQLREHFDLHSPVHWGGTSPELCHSGTIICTISIRACLAFVRDKNKRCTSCVILKLNTVLKTARRRVCSFFHADLAHCLDRQLERPCRELFNEPRIVQKFQKLTELWPKAFLPPKSGISGFGHRTMTAPLPVCSVKLSIVSPG